MGSLDRSSPLSDPEEQSLEGNSPRLPGSGQPMQGERRVITILFCDVVGSTAMAEQLDPEEWAEIMDEAFHYLTEPVHRYEGRVARLMGDGILAFFGAPLAHEDDPQRAVLAGLDILSGIQAFIQKIQQEYGLDFNVRVGISTGPVVVGEIGSDIAMEYTAMGDAVNLAARMEQTAQPGSVQVAESTFRLVAPIFDFEILSGIQVKGKSEPVRAYRILGRKANPGRLRGIAGLESPLIGRAREMEALKRSLADLRLGRGGIITLIGEAGLGKSRLIDEVKAIATDDEGRRTNDESLIPSSFVLRPSSVSWLEGHGISYNSQRPYGLFLQQLRQSCEVDENDTPEEAWEKILERMKLPDDQKGESSRLLNLIQVLLHGDTDPANIQLTGEAFKRELFHTIHEVYRLSSMRSPLVLVCDDLHWADPASIELLMHMFQLADQSPVLFLCALRPYRQSPGWQVKLYAETNFPHCYQEFLLSPLSDEDGDQLISSLLSVSRLPADLSRRVLHKAEGNPFFVEEVVRVLIERGAVLRDEGSLHWKAAQEIDEIAIPDTLHALLIARIDRLDPDVRRTLQLASVIGRRFSYRLLKHLSEDGVVLNQHLVTLQRSELVREAARAPELEYVFRHELTRDAAYQTILHRRLRQIHLRVGEAIEALFPDRLDQEADRLADHFYAARDFERALKYYVLAGDAAARLYANREAAASYGKALEIARTRASDDQLAEIYTRRGRAMELNGEYDQALENYQELERLGREGGKPSLELAGLIPQTTIYSTPNVMHNSQQGRELSVRALALARQLKNPRAEAKALWNLMMLIIYNNEDPESAIPYGEQSLAIARQHNLREEMAYGLHDLGRTYLITGQWEKGWAASEEARQLWLELGNQPLLADNLTTVAETVYLTGNFELAMQNAQEALSINRSIGSEWGQAYTLATIAPIYLEWGEIDEAVQAILESITLARRANFRPPLLTGPFLLTLIYFDLGHLGKSLETIQETITLSESLVEMQHYRPVLKALRLFLEGDAAGASQLMKEASGKIMIDVPDIYLGPMIIALACEIEQAHGDYEEVLRITEVAVGKMKAANLPILLPDLLYYQGRARVALGQLDEGLRLLEASVEEARRLGSRRSLWPVLAELAHLAVQRGDADQAEILRREGREVVEYIASHIGSHELRTSFTGLPQVQWLMEEG